MVKKVQQHENTNRRKYDFYAMDRDFLRRSCGLKRTDRVRNEEIRKRMNMDGDLIDEIPQKTISFVWTRKNEERIPKNGSLLKDEKKGRHSWI